jgi:hypothetical protein
MMNSADPRALRLLEDLFEEHPELSREVADFERDLEACCRAVQNTLEWHQPLPRR